MVDSYRIMHAYFVVRSETELVLAAYRTQLLNPGDIENVKKAQAGYKAQLLSQLLGQAAPNAAPQIDFVPPLMSVEQKASFKLFNTLNFVLQYCPTHESDTELRARFATLGIGVLRARSLDRLVATGPERYRLPSLGLCRLDVDSPQLFRRTVSCGALADMRD